MNDQKGDGWPAFELDDLSDLSVVGGTRSPIGLLGEEGLEAPAVAWRFGAFFDDDFAGPPTYDEWLKSQPSPADLGLGDAELPTLDVRGRALKMNQTPTRAFGAPPSIVFERLVPKYERRFGAMPPVRSADVEEVNRLMREALASDAGTPLPQRSGRQAS